MVALLIDFDFRSLTCTHVMHMQPLPEHGVYTVFVELGETKLEVSSLCAINSNHYNIKHHNVQPCTLK